MIVSSVGSDGSIPACAGEPSWQSRRSGSDRVYPRVCGGTALGWMNRGAQTGLSPRVRGNRAPIGHTLADLGSIPACAGEPCSNRAHAGRSRVYPRVCGGTVLVFRPDVRKSGLSPRVRGNRPASLSPICLIGSIPACAGEPDCRAKPLLSSPVYPRVCGGTLTDGDRFVLGAGLSPRVRGNLYASAGLVCAVGSIPACAGEPCGLLSGSIPACAGEPACPAGKPSYPWVYPRVCGGTDYAFVPF